MTLAETRRRGWPGGALPSAGPAGVPVRAGVRRQVPVALWPPVPVPVLIGPSAPSRFLPWFTPRAVDRPLSDSIVPIPASTSQESPRQVRAAALYQAR
jgi:hypothetical protein